MTATKVSPKQVSELRGRTGAGMMDCKRALEEAEGNMDQAAEILRKKGIARADKRTGKSVSQGLVVSYIHHNKQVGVLVELNCETDFVARTDDFVNLAQDIALHVASADPIGVAPEDIPEALVASERRIAEEQAEAEDKPEHIREKIVEGKIKKFIGERALLDQPFVKDDSKTVGQLIKELSGTLGEAISVKRFTRFRVGEE